MQCQSVAGLVLLLPQLIHLQIDVVDLDLVRLPCAGVILPEHPHRADRQQHPRDRKDLVELLCIAPGCFVGGHMSNLRARGGLLAMIHKLSMYSGIEMKYFRLIVQRRSILIGRSAINSSRLVITMYRRNPILMNRCWKNLLITTSSGGTIVK